MAVIEVWPSVFSSSECAAYEVTDAQGRILCIARDMETGDRIATGLRLIDILGDAKQEAGVTGFMLGHIALWLAEAETGQPE